MNQSSRPEVERRARKSVIRSLLEILEEGSHVSLAGPQSVQRIRYWVSDLWPFTDYSLIENVVCRKWRLTFEIAQRLRWLYRTIRKIGFNKRHMKHGVNTLWCWEFQFESHKPNKLRNRKRTNPLGHKFLSRFFRLFELKILSIEENFIPNRKINRPAMKISRSLLSVLSLF